MIGDIQLFASDVLPKYFDYTNVGSFQRQLRKYLFRKISRGESLVRLFGCELRRISARGSSGRLELMLVRVLRRQERERKYRRGCSSPSFGTALLLWAKGIRAEGGAARIGCSWFPAANHPPREPLVPSTDRDAHNVRLCSLSACMHPPPRHKHRQAPGLLQQRPARPSSGQDPGPPTESWDNRRRRRCGLRPAAFEVFRAPSRRPGRSFDPDEPRPVADSARPPGRSLCCQDSPEASRRSRSRCPHERARRRGGRAHGGRRRVRARERRRLRRRVVVVRVPRAGQAELLRVAEPAAAQESSRCER